MQYMMLPLNEHFDLGFGAVADSFMDAANALKEDGPTPFLNAHLPVSFLYRHAIELFLKSAITIFHRKLNLPYGEPPGSDEPQVPVHGKWKPMYTVHAVKPLHAYMRELFVHHADYLKAHTNTDWSFPKELASWIDNIDATDSSSTFFRYPVTKHGNKDKEKSAIQKNDNADILSTIADRLQPLKMFMVTDSNDQILSTYTFENAQSQAMIETLSQAAELLSNCHAALVGELTGGR
ncbi:hypothetical protein GTP91_14810 [Rugamonas sp. FT82W]|uniref:HEPN domain-containing protein n=1 Tax=Duganella vulcania TaxID=2692166 RepID=A0A845G6T9_9BURK|nr:hypothetical protein [Duganella vulcania]MYM88438.1 hypothetical protein [Duganella vulcania]